MLKYIELKAGAVESAPAWVARVRASKSGRTIYFNGRALKRAHLPSANHYDLANQEPYWVAGIGADGASRSRAGAPKIAIEAGAVEEYLRVTGSAELDLTRFEVIADLDPTDPSKFQDQEDKH